MTDESRLLLVAVDLARPIGLPPGSYLAGTREAAGDGCAPDTLVVRRHAATTLRAVGGRRRRARAAAAGEVAHVELTRAMHVLASRPCAGRREAREQLDEWRRSEELARALVQRALDVMNRAVRGHRYIERDPYLGEIAVAEPRAVHIGFGTPDEIARARWEEAFAVGDRGRGDRDRTDRTRDATAVADLLSGRAVVPGAAELLLRAELDIDQGRLVAAALQLRAAADLMDAERRHGTTSPSCADARRLAERALEAGVPHDPHGFLAEIEAVANALWASLEPSGPPPDGVG